MKTKERIAVDNNQKNLKEAGLKTPRCIVHEQELKLFRSLLALHVYPNLPITMKVKNSLKQKDK